MGAGTRTDSVSIRTQSTPSGHIPREPTEYQAERAIAERLVDLVAGKLPWPDIDVERALPWVEKQSGLSLAPGQAEAVRLALTSKAIVITGGPGVGKTTLVDAILRILAAKRVELVLCAPTGRAARRMSEATELEARTNPPAARGRPRHRRLQA